MYSLGKMGLLEILIALQLKDFINICYGFLPNKWVLKIIVDVRIRHLLILKTYLLCTSLLPVEMICYSTNQNNWKHSFFTVRVWNLPTSSFLEMFFSRQGEFCRANVWGKLLRSPPTSKSSNLISLKKQWKLI